MTRFRYNRQTRPATPFMLVEVIAADSGTRSEQVPAQVDTGADCTVIPSQLLTELDAVCVSDVLNQFRIVLDGPGLVMDVD